MPEHTFAPGVLAEIKKDRETRQRQAFEDRIEASVNTFNRRLMRLETEFRNHPAPAPPLGESFFRELLGIMRSYVDTKFGRLKNENEAIMNRLKYLETQPLPDYKGVYEPGQNYPKNSLCTHEGSLWISRSPTGSAPGNPGGSDWKMCVKRGRDGKDGKDWRETAPAKGWGEK
jgi:hypothetical protein